MRINGERLKKRMELIAEIGKTLKGGVNRLALTDEDRQARDLFVRWLKELQLKVTIDDFGNIYGIKEGKDPNLPPIVIGSHLDTVPNGGRFDGVLGVLAGLEVVESFIDHGFEHDYPLMVVNFTNEEGARFPKPMLGSGGITGVFKKEDVYQLKDDEGISFIEELVRIGYLGDVKNRLKDIKAFFELHIEQGPVLEEQNAEVGIVKGIQGLSWHEITFYGQSDHAGTTPLTYRKDALISATKAINQLQNWVTSLQDDTSITFGKFSIKPNAVNVIPSEAKFTIDLRHPDEKTLRERIETMKKIIIHIAIEEDTNSHIVDLSYMKPAHFSKDLINILTDICHDMSLNLHYMYSGAGHDAMYMNNLGDTVMIFVPSVNGKSHCEEEYSRWDDIIKGANVLFHAVKRISKVIYDV